MAKSSLQKAIEKQQKEAKKMAENEVRRQRANSAGIKRRCNRP